MAQVSYPYKIYFAQFDAGLPGRRRARNFHIIVDITAPRDRGGPIGIMFSIQGSLAQGYRLIKQENLRYCKVDQFRGRVFLGYLDPRRFEEFLWQLGRVEIRNHDPTWFHEHEWALAAYRRLVAQGFLSSHYSPEALGSMLRDAEEMWERGDI